MKKTLCIFLLFINSVLLCRAKSTYTFDYKLYFGKSKENIGMYIMNSDNASYFIYLYDKRGTLYDYENSIIRKFEYSEISNKKSYHFTSHEKFHPQNEILIDDILVEKTAENKYSITCFPKEQRKNPSLKLIMRIKGWILIVVDFQ